MATAAPFFSQALVLFTRPSLPPMVPLADQWGFRQSSFSRFWSPSPRLLVHSSSFSTGTPFGGLESESKSPKRSSKESILLNLVQGIQPFDVSLIQKDVPANTIDAMKRTISGMLGLLPSNQFHVFVEALWEPLLKLLISSTKTGYTVCLYTLHNAEYRLCLERNLKIHNEHSEQSQKQTVEYDRLDMLIDRFPTISDFLGKNVAYCNQEGSGGLEELTPEIQEYISYLQFRLNSAEKELDDIKRSNPGPQMQQCVEEEKSDLLDYLRSLEHEKVLELSKPTCPAVDEIIRSVVHGLAALFPEMQLSPPILENRTVGTLHIEKDNCAELVDDPSTQFQPITKVPRDYLARLLFWCMLLGHYIRGLEYRIELMEFCDGF